MVAGKKIAIFCREGMEKVDPRNEKFAIDRLYCADVRINILLISKWTVIRDVKF